VPWTLNSPGSLYLTKKDLLSEVAKFYCLYGFGLRFNKTQEHFPSLRDYNDYLEEVEDMSELPSLFVSLSFE
jgi:hypothetical protein